MNTFKKIMLLTLLTSCISSIALGMDQEGVEAAFAEIDNYSITLAEAIKNDLEPSLPHVDVDQLREMIAAIPIAQRYNAFMTRGNHCYSQDKYAGTILMRVLRLCNATYIKRVVRMLLGAVPEAQWADFVMARNIYNFTALHYLALNKELAATPNIQIAVATMLIEAVPEQQRSEFVMVKGKVKNHPYPFLQYLMGGVLASQFADGELVNFLRQYETLCDCCFF